MTDLTEVCDFAQSGTPCAKGELIYIQFRNMEYVCFCVNHRREGYEKIARTLSHTPSMKVHQEDEQLWHQLREEFRD
jgi:hypothetical protein